MKKKEYIIQRALDFVTFRPCIFCGKGVVFEMDINVCPVCQPLIHRFGASGTICGHKFMSPLPYTGNVRHAMQRFKFEGKRYLGYTFARIALDRLREFPWTGEIDCIACVPMGKRARLYNQCAVIAAHISDELGLPFDEFAIAKIKDNPPFYTLSRDERIKRIKGSFRVEKEEYFRGRKVLLIDDVYTTGSTMAECSSVVSRAGATEIFCMTACYGDDA